jgi:putative hydrolase of the HAD superfamily
MKISLRKYSHLFFDLDNTLWDFEKNSFFAMKETFRRFGFSERKIEFQLFFDTYKKHNHRLWQEYRNGDIHKNELTRLRFQQTFDDLNIEKADPFEMNLLYLNKMPKQTHLVAGTIRLLEYLKSNGYLLFIITNGFREVQYKKLEDTGLKPFFTKVFISEDVKAPKPSPEIFEYAIKSANARKKSSLMVGDDLDVDILGALNFGIDAVLFDSGRQYENRLDTPAELFKNKFCVIHSLPELLSKF